MLTPEVQRWAGGRQGLPGPSRSEWGFRLSCEHREPSGALGSYGSRDMTGRVVAGGEFHPKMCTRVACRMSHCSCGVTGCGLWA